MLLNLHTHLEGSLRPATAAHLARHQGVPSPAAGWDAALRMRCPGTLTEFLAHVAAGYPLLGDADAIAQVANEAVQDAATDGAAFVELRLGPSTHARPGFAIADVLTAATAGAIDGARSTGAGVGVIACLLRHDSAAHNAEVAEAACTLAGNGVTGLDLAGDERIFPDAAPYAALFAQAREAGLGLTAHAAEAAPGPAARRTAQLLGVSRIGHGSAVADDPETLAWAADTGVCFEVCATSNLLTGAATSVKRHPVRRFLAAGCRVVLGDDDPTTTGSRLSNDVRLLRDDGVVADSDLRKIAEISVEVAFCDDATRRRLRETLDHQGGR